MQLNELFFQEALRELPIGSEGVDEVAAMIEKECKTFLKAYRSTGKYLYRGMRSTVRTIHRKNSTGNMFATIRKNRTPVDVEPEQHDRLEKLFTNLGLKANRKNSIFCTADRVIAKEWNSDVKVISCGTDGQAPLLKTLKQVTRIIN